METRPFRERCSLLLAALATLAFAGVAIPLAGAANPPLKPLRALCAAQHGMLFASLTGQYVVCDSDPARGFTEVQLKAARLLCTHAYDGRFVLSPPAGDRTFPLWYCVFRFDPEQDR